MKKGLIKKLAVLMSAVMVASCFGACGKEAEAPAAQTTDATTETAETTDVEPAADGEKVLVVGYDYFSSKFSPFFATTAYDQDVTEVTGVYLLGSDREGNVITKGIEGETIPFNGTDYTYFGIADCDITENGDGTMVYSITMRDDVKFSDGEPMTADDAIFSMYAMSDPTYDGSSTFYTLPITGMADYRAGMDTLFNLLVAAGKDNTDFSLWDEATQTAFWTSLEEAGAAFVQEIVDYCIAAGYAAEGDAPASVIANWGFEAPEGATTTDIFYIMADAYGFDLTSLSDTESAGTSLFDFMADYATYTTGVSTGDSAANIAGIVKTGDYSFDIVMDSFDATAIYKLGFCVAPLHYYGDTALYDYDNNMFGFNKGDLSIVKEKTTKPLGAGPYVFESFENGVITFSANPNYYKGEPKTKTMIWKETASTDKLSGVAAGTFDISDPSMNLETLNNIKGYNSNGEIKGDVLETILVDNLGYGYIGINAATVNVGGKPDSDESKDLRKAIATLLAVYRDTVINSYYGEMATVIQYPISNTSWAAPKPADEGYQLAFSVDVDGNSIYTADMTDEQKYEAALQAAIGFLKAAGYTWDEAEGKFNAAPEGANMTYEVIIPADGVGDHPAYGVLTAVKEALASVGLTLEINDPSDSNILWDALDANTHELWAAAWGASTDPDMYQIYHSDNANGNGTGDNHYNITDANLDQMIMDARNSADQSYRKATYKEALNTIIDWAVEIPAYQRQNAFVVSPERVNMATVTPDITTFWDWENDLELIELN